MQSYIKNVFVIVGTMMLSLILFSLILGDLGRAVTWGLLEPVFNRQLEDSLFQDADGDIYNRTVNENYDNLVTLDNEYFNY